jgi:hypothetical protein
MIKEGIRGLPGQLDTKSPMLMATVHGTLSIERKSFPRRQHHLSAPLIQNLRMLPCISRLNLNRNLCDVRCITP